MQVEAWVRAGHPEVDVGDPLTTGLVVTLGVPPLTTAPLRS
jgi:hypothetical protein